MPESTQKVIWNICGEMLQYKIYFAQEHLEKYPNHQYFSVYNVDKN